MKKFSVTEEHLKLMRCFNVGWQDCEFGAPEIDPKRPYGNSDVPNDIHKILTGERLYSDCMDSTLTKKYTALHRTTETALQVCLAIGEFKAGDYEADDYDDNWRLL